MNFLSKFVGLSFAFLFYVMPIRWRWGIGKALGILWFDILRFRRFTVLKNLTIAFPELSKEERLSIARNSLYHLCYGFMEFTQMPFMNQNWLKSNAVFEGEENFKKAQEQGKGILILSLHVGNGDMGIASLSLKGYPIHVISKKFKNKFFNDLWFGMRERMGTGFLEPHGTQLPFEILKLCKKNQGVIFVIDQFMGRPFGIESTFFGRKTGTQKGLALFAMKTGAPVLPIYTYRDAELRTHVRIEEPVLWEASGDKDLQILQMTEKYNRKLEEIIKRHKEQWMWVHRRWKRYE
jgi:KDO2-lipid IV(A) lauroyltransferase